jgi:sulfite exporter TauE/SafE
LIHVNAIRGDPGHPLKMLEGLHWLGGLCTSDTALQGVFVLGQMSERMARLPPERLCERQRIGNGLLLPYHLGRLTTYAVLGAAAAKSAAVLGHFSWFRSVSAILLMIAALLFLTRALRRVLPAFGKIDRAPWFWGRLIGLLTGRIARGSVLGEYLLGIALGFLPCGFLYAAVTAAAASARPELGAVVMVAFGLGTAPVLMVIGVAGHAAGRRWNRGISKVAPALIALNAALLLLLAWQRLT